MKQETAVFRAGGNPLEDPAFTDRKVQPAKTDYAYASGRIRALEASLMDAARTLRMTEAQDTMEFGRLLSEAGYPAAETNGRSLNAGYARACAVAREVSVEKEYIDLFYLEGDIINAKVFLKHRAGGSAAPYESLATKIASPSMVEPYRLFEAVRDNDPGETRIPAWLWHAIQEAWSEYVASGDASRIDQRLSIAYAEECRVIADILGNEWFSDLLAMRSDLANLGMLLRIRRSGFVRDILRESLLPGGKVSIPDILAMAELPDDALAEAWRNTPYARIAAEFSIDYARSRGAVRFGKAVDDEIMRHVRKARVVSFGPEVPVAYVLAMQTEVQNARIILAFLRNQMDPAGARDMLRDTYV
jgi:V/A-type H+-transporting ATPase subunit C